MTWVPKLDLVEQSTGRRFQFPVERAFNGGWAGRDKAAVQAHIDELAAIGVPGPSRTPTLYTLANSLVSTADAMQVQHGKTSGEVEYVLLIAGPDDVYVTVGSDHTDRDLETINIEWSKQAYPNVFAPEVWSLKEVSGHWDQLVLRCWVTKDGKRDLYQEGALTALQPPDVWFSMLNDLFGRVPPNIAVMSGTIPSHGGLVYADAYDMEIHDPVLGRTIRHSYAVQLLKERVV